MTVRSINGGFAVSSITIDGSGRSTFIPEDRVVAATVAALELIEYTKHPFRLSAPMWVREELQRRGFPV